MKFDKVVDKLLEKVPDEWYLYPMDGTVIVIYYAVDRRNIPRYVVALYYRNFKNVRTLVFHFDNGRIPQEWTIKNSTLHIKRDFKLIKVARIDFESGTPLVYYETPQKKTKAEVI